MNNNPLSSNILSNLLRTSSKDKTKIINRESSTIEFKQSYNHGSIAQYFKTMAAFANKNGGYIIFGIGDKPRSLLGMNEKSFKQFEELKVEVFTNSLLEYFSPEIKWEHCTFEFREKSFGVIYTYELAEKPCICKKQYDEGSYILREGDIYYRYNGRSEKIKYSELSNILIEQRNKEKKEWLDLLGKIAQIGVSNSALLDLKTGVLSGNTGSIVLNEELLKKIVFIQSGKFVETGGLPTLRLIGDIREISTGKIIIDSSAKKVVKAIEVCDLVNSFLTNATIEEPLEYVKRIIFENSANYPVYFYLHQANCSIEDAIKYVNEVTSRKCAKDKLLKRLEGASIERKQFTSSTSPATKKKKEFYDHWVNKTIPEIIDDLNHCIEAIFYLPNEVISNNKEYIFSELLRIYSLYYENANSGTAGNIRKAICLLDEFFYKNLI